MHSRLLTLSIALLLTLELIGIRTSSLPLSTIAIFLAIPVAILGLPHGALDHRIGTDLFRELGRPWSTIAFFVCYLFVAAAVIAGWYLSPVVTILAFFSLSAWHFGLEEDEREHRNWWHLTGMIARGGMVIWVPVIFHGQAITELLGMIIPTHNSMLAEQVVSVVQAMTPFLALLTLVDLIAYVPHSSATPEQQATRANAMTWNHRARVLLFAVLFLAAHPLISFGIYFCGWHSVRGFFHLREEFGDTTRRLIVKLVPLTLAALILFAGGLAFWSMSEHVTPALIRTLFVGLSAVAVPHLLLHVLADSRQAHHPARQGVS